MLRYHLVAADFSDVSRLREKLEESEVDYQCPTLVLAECALVYADSKKVGTSAPPLSSQSAPTLTAKRYLPVLTLVPAPKCAKIYTYHFS